MFWNRTYGGGGQCHDGERIATACNRAGLTQAELASAISVDRSALTKIEIGSRRVSALELTRIAEALSNEPPGTSSS
jgi:transcriptional regulator with XRE-family HTH domain